MEDLKQVKTWVEHAVPGARLELIHNDSPSGQHSLRLEPAHALAVARFLRDDSRLRLDYCSNVTGVDWPEQKIQEKRSVRRTVDGQEQDVEETVETVRPGYLEAVYHLYSMELRQGPLVLRQRTQDRASGVHVASLTPVWRACEFQEREIYDLYGVIFDGHPDLRRLLMWDGFADHPMRKDYVSPDDYEYEPTAHDEVLARAKERQKP